MASAVSVTNEINKRLIEQVPNIALLIHAAQNSTKPDGTPLSGIEKGAAVSQVVADDLAQTTGVPANVVAVAQSVNLVYQLLVGFGFFKKKAAAPAPRA